MESTIQGKEYFLPFYCWHFILFYNNITMISPVLLMFFSDFSIGITVRVVNRALCGWGCMVQRLWSGGRRK